MTNFPLYCILYFTLILSLSTSYETPTGCTPFGLRLALGTSFYHKSSNEQLSVWFNTKLECLKSYVTFEEDPSSIKKIYCDSKKISFSNYTSFVHKCSIDFLDRGDSYEYLAYGWSGNTSEPAVPFQSSNIKAHLIDGLKPIKILTLADWSYLELKAKVYGKLDNAFQYLLKSEQKPDLIYMGGDYAYDLSTNYGKNYQNFLIMLSQVASHWPCIITTGNHEYKTANDFMVFNLTFQLYNLTHNNITMLNLEILNLILIDPYGILYEKANKAALLSSLRAQLESADKRKPIIVSSHYPLACSATANFCKNLRQQLIQFWQLMIDFNVVLYIGAHYHTYQRLYPFLKSGNFSSSPGPYNLNHQSKMLISVVQAIAGNDKSIVESYSKIESFTAALSFNQTGFGIMNVGPKDLTYSHYISINPVTPVDSLKIQFAELLEKQQRLNLREQ